MRTVIIPENLIHYAGVEKQISANKKTVFEMEKGEVFFADVNGQKNVECIFLGVEDNNLIVKEPNHSHPIKWDTLTWKAALMRELTVCI